MSSILTILHTDEEEMSKDQIILHTSNNNERTNDKHSNRLINYGYEKEQIMLNSSFPFQVMVELPGIHLDSHVDFLYRILIVD
jgi:hypothetical protein